MAEPFTIQNENTIPSVRYAVGTLADLLNQVKVTTEFRPSVRQFMLSDEEGPSWPSANVESIRASVDALRQLQVRAAKLEKGLIERTERILHERID